MNILWITNKYVDGSSLSRYYPDFLKCVEENIATLGHQVHFVFFSDAMSEKVKTKNNFNYIPRQIGTGNIRKTANQIENDYQFTFKQAYFPDLIQVSKSQDYRQIHLPETEFSDLKHLVPKFLYLNKIITQKKIDAVFCDQSSEVEMEFGRAICWKRKKIFLRQSDSFLGRCVFYQQFAFGKERVALPVLDRKTTRLWAKNFADDFVKNNRQPYSPMSYLPADIKEYYLPRLLHFYRYPQYIKLALLKPYLFFEEKILKALIEDKFDPNKPYLFFGLHLPTESTVTLRSLPYMTQFSLIESISRVLPFGYYLYVREHPGFRQHFPFSYLKKIGNLPCVRLISSDIPIAKILKHSRGVLTYNATTGIEALMYGKPVLSFAPNVYHKLHPAAHYCSDLYELGAKLTELVNTSVERQDTYEYIYKMFRSTSKISICAGTFLSESDSANKAPVFVKELLASIDYCLKNEVW